MVWRYNSDGEKTELGHFLTRKGLEGEREKISLPVSFMTWNRSLWGNVALYGK
jgi:hypothetical protein